MRSIYGQAGLGWFGQWQFLLSLPPLLPALLPAVVLPSNSNNNNNGGSGYPCRIFTTYQVYLCVCVTHAVVQLPRRSILLMAIDLCARRDFILGM